jgi:hypothetical protein
MNKRASLRDLADEIETLRIQTVGGFTRAELNARKDGEKELASALKNFGKRAEYELIDKIATTEPHVVEPYVINDRHQMEKVIVRWAAAPNKAMKPHNTAAKKIFAAWQKSISGTCREPTHWRFKPTAPKPFATPSARVDAISQSKGYFQKVAERWRSFHRGRILYDNPNNTQRLTTIGGLIFALTGKRKKHR